MAKSAENGEAKRERRPTPEGEVVSLEELDAVVQTTRTGVWTERAQWFYDHPGEVKRFPGVSPTTATHLKREYNLSAATRNTSDDGKSADLYVAFYPEGMEPHPLFLTNLRKKDEDEAEQPA